MDRRDGRGDPARGRLQAQVSPLTSAITTPMVPERPCCDCCAQLLRALAGIKVELSKIRERLDQGESERAGWGS